MAAEPTGVEDVTGFDAIVLAGGRARRLGGVDKPGLDVAGTPLLDRVLAAVDAAAHIVVVGPARATARTVRWRQERPAGGGPVAAIAAGLGEVSAESVLVLAADLPAIAPAVPELLAALHASTGDAAVLVDASGRANHLAAAWRTARLRGVLATLGDPNGLPARALYADADVHPVADRDGWGRDTDTWDDIADARRRLDQGSTA